MARLCVRMRVWRDQSLNVSERRTLASPIARWSPLSLSHQ